MKTETRELYCYITGTEPFKTRYENLSTKMVSVTIATRGLVKDAIGQYGKDYGNGNGFEIFSEEDFKECVVKIIEDIKEREGVYVMDEYTRENLLRYVDDEARLYEPSEVENWDMPRNSLESEGVLWTASKWLADKFDWETIENAYDNIHGWRDNVKGGSFNIDEDYPLYDTREILTISDVILKNNCVLLEVRNKEEDMAVAYIYAG